jgi:gamma-glutamyl-gamma-aminobutyrate hydrolase PuuD
MNNPFDWQSQLQATVYSSFPEVRHKPVIGITGNYGELTCKLAETYYKSVSEAGGVPLIIPPLSDPDAIINTIGRIDGLLLSGGADFNPLYAGEEPQRLLGGINAERDLPELLLTRLAYNRQLPMLGICRGIQTLAMALDGRVAQDIGPSASVKHSQEADRSVATHSVVVDEQSAVGEAEMGIEHIFFLVGWKEGIELMAYKEKQRVVAEAVAVVVHVLTIEQKSGVT